VLLQVQVQEGRKPALNIQDGAQPAPCFIGGFYETLAAIWKNVVQSQIELAICTGFRLISNHFFLLFLSPKITRITLCSSSSSWQTNLNLY